MFFWLAALKRVLSHSLLDADSSLNNKLTCGFYPVSKILYGNACIGKFLISYNNRNADQHANLLFHLFLKVTDQAAMLLQFNCPVVGFLFFQQFLSILISIFAQWASI